MEKNFTLDDLQPNDIITTRENKQYLCCVFSDYDQTSKIGINDTGWTNIDGSYMIDMTNEFHTIMDIVEVRRPTIKYRLVNKYWNDAPIIWRR